MLAQLGRGLGADQLAQVGLQYRQYRVAAPKHVIRRNRGFTRGMLCEILDETPDRIFARNLSFIIPHLAATPDF